jgi:DNA-binding transcriptional LysR family regulator
MKQNYTIPRNLLDGVEAFLRVADRASFRMAAEDLGVSPSAISQTVRQMEDRIGVPLFIRTTRSVGLTEAGALFHAQAAPAFASLVSAWESARTLGERPAGLLRINMPRAVVPLLIEPIIADFCAQYPDVDVEVIGEDAVVDLAASGHDAGIRLGELLEADMVCVRLSPPFRFVVVGAPSYLDRRGLGLAMVSEPLVIEQLEAGRLDIVLDRFAPTSPGLFLHYPGHAQVLPKLRAFIDHVKAALATGMLDRLTRQG